MEYLEIFDEQGNSLGQKLRKEVHRDGDWHRVVDVWIYDSQKRILLQRRSATKKKFPNHWDFSVGGHISAGESWESALEREVEEELGIPTKFSEVEFFGERKEETRVGDILDREIARTYFLKKDSEISELRLQEEEVAEVAWVNFSELERRVHSPEFVPHRKEYLDAVLAYFRDKFKV